MSSQDALQQNTQDINRLQNELSSLQDKVRLANIRDAVEDLDTCVSGFPQRVQQLRSRHYAFEKTLEPRSRSFSSRWSSIKTNVRNEINRQSHALEIALQPVENKMTRLGALRNSPTAARPLIRQLENELANMQDKATSADKTLRGMFDKMAQEINDLNLHLKAVEAMLDHLEAASFGLMPNEAGIAAVEAVFVEGKEDKNDPKGILFLTDQRLLFERKQEVAKKKVLFIATEKEMVQELMMEMPLGMVEEILTSKRGLFKNEDHIELTFQPNAPFREAHLHLFGQDCIEWKTAIQRAKMGEFDRDRTIAIDEKAEEVVKNAPTVCPGCGASIQQKVLRGMDALTCQYCGTVIRL